MNDVSRCRVDSDDNNCCIFPGKTQGVTMQMLRIYVDIYTVQVAICTQVHMCALVNAWLVKEKPPPVQVAVGGSSMASHVCTLLNALVGTRKSPPAQIAGDAHCKCK